MTFYNRKLNNQRRQALAQALAGSKRDNTQITPIQAVARGYVRQSQNDDLAGGISSFATNGLKLGKSLYDGFKNDGATSQPVSEGINNFVLGKSDYGSVGNAINDSFLGNSTSGSAVGNAIGSEVGTSALGNVAPYGGLIMGGINGLGNFAKSGDYKDGLQGIFNIDKDNSDVMQTLGGAGQGALLGAPFGPIGMAVGGLLGAGASFLDDI